MKLTQPPKDEITKTNREDRMRGYELILEKPAFCDARIDWFIAQLHQNKDNAHQNNDIEEYLKIKACLDTLQNNIQ